MYVMFRIPLGILMTVKRAGNAFFVNNYRVNRSMVFGEYNLQQFEKNLVTFTEESLK
jgi:hypothetical protein